MATATDATLKLVVRAGIWIHSGSLFKCKPTAPEEIFYAYSMSVKGKKPQLGSQEDFDDPLDPWKWDLFDALGHKYGCNFESGRVCGLEGMNTEICDASGCISAPGLDSLDRPYRQEHCTFFLQWFFCTPLNKETTLGHGLVVHSCCFRARSKLYGVYTA